MSYILEGLKKLEQKRRPEEGTPGLLSFREEKTPRPKRTTLWPYLLFGALLLNAGVIVWWLGPWRSLEPSPLPQKTVPGHRGTGVMSVPVEIERPSRPDSKKEISTPKIIKELPKRPDLKKTKESIAPKVKKTPEPKSLPGTVPVSPESKSSATSKVAPEGPVVKLSDLPSEIKKGLPALKISVHFYSPDKRTRFVTINDKTLHEGEALSEGLKVIEINPEGTVLHYKGHRFLISVNDSF